jgi:hypothetical protein
MAQQKDTGGLDLSGLQDTLGGLTQALGGLVGTAGQAVTGLLSQLTGTLQQLQQKAQGGDEQASKVYDEVLSVLQKSAGEGKGEADELLNQLGEGKKGSGRSQKSN